MPRGAARHFKKPSHSYPYTRRVVFEQVLDKGLGCASYLIGDEDAGEALVVDPPYAIEKLVAAAERHGLRITRVIETHNHADHVAGHGRFALEHGTRVSIHPLAEPEYEFDPLADGDEITVGDVTVRVIHTPGHRPEHCALLVDDRLLLTGDSLFVGDVARPDLAVGAAEGAEGLFHSLRRLEELPNEVRVFPGHVAGSLCGAGMSSDPSSTIGAERRYNRALKIDAVEDFVADALGKNAPRPPNMDRIVELNRGPFLGAPAPLERLDTAGGAIILDVREPEEFAAGHLPGAINVGLDGSSFATRAAFVLPTEGVVLHAADANQAEQAARGLRSVGVLDLAGYLVDPNGATEQLDPIDLDELERLLGSDGVELVDVREKDERDDGYIVGSTHIPYRLVGALADGLPTDKPVVTICETGARASLAASVLSAEGIDVRPVISGGVPDWEERGGQTVEFRRCGS
jgi:hydroxyacylglutathione hydrolase